MILRLTINNYVIVDFYICNSIKRHIYIVKVAKAKTMKAIRKVAKSGQIAITPEIIELMGIEPGDYVEFDVIRIVHKASGAKMEESGIENPLMVTTPEPILA